LFLVDTFSFEPFRVFLFYHQISIVIVLTIKALFNHNGLGLFMALVHSCPI